MNFRKYCPAIVKLWLKTTQSRLRDINSGAARRLVKASAARNPLPVRHTVTQRIMPGPLFANKVNNLKLAIERINYLAIPQGKIFSFNTIVGRTVASKGYKPGRSLKDGLLKEETGGGVCQLAWIMHQLCLATGIVVLERHHHSRDIYDDNSRFAPLGSDATVVYGYKDFRIQNNYSEDICFSFSIDNQQLTCSVCSILELPQLTVRHETISCGRQKICAHTFVDNQFHCECFYDR